MLSNCEECHYFHPKGCGVQPIYHKNSQILDTYLTPAELNHLYKDLPSCPDLEGLRGQKLSLKLSIPFYQQIDRELSKQEWKEVLNALPQQARHEQITISIQQLCASLI